MREIERLSEEYPRIAKRIVATWGTQDCRDYMMSLINDSRDGNRQGFQKDTASTIMTILDIHDRKYPLYDDVTDIIPYRYVRPIDKKVTKTDWSWLIQVKNILVFVIVCILTYKLLR